MNLAYAAANYFIEVLFRSPNLTINFDNLKTFRKLIGREVCPTVAEYLDKESEDDLFIIFRKFPDIFLLKPDAITFTDTFTFLHNHLDSYEFYFNGVRDIRTILYLENYAVSYFSQCLKSLGPQQDVFLFTRIMNDKTNEFNSYFRLYNIFESQIFFEAHADVFLMYDGIVSLRKEKLLTNPLLSKTLAPNIMLVFINAVYFLLTCFKSLHYIELRQCICYVFADVKNILNRFPVIKQREFFEMLPHLNMTQLGYLSLKYRNVNICIPNLDKTNLFIVCLLAFNKIIHYKQIVKEVNRRVPSTSFKGLAEAELLKFFNNFPVIFKTSYEGYITLLPTFIFPVFTAEIVYIQQNDHDASKSVDISQSAFTSKKIIRVPVSIPQSDQSTSTTDAKSLNDNKSLQLQVVPPLQNDILSVIDNNCKHFLGTLMLPESINKQITLSILFLVKHFRPVNKECVIITLFHVMEAVHNAFCNLSTSDRRLFITYCSQFINAISDHVSKECIAVTLFEEMEKEVFFLFIAYLLTSQKEMHFEKIVKSIRKKKVIHPISSLTVFGQYNYFLEIKKYLKMGSDGYISLDPPFELIKRNVDTYTSCLSEKCYTTYSEMLKGITTKEKVMKAEISAVISEILNCSFPVTGHKVPLGIRKILLTVSHLFRKCQKALNTQQIFESSVFVLEDLRKYVSNLSVNERNYFINECYQYIEKVRSFNKILVQDICCLVDISIEERDNLFIAYFVAGNKTNNHMHSITAKLKRCGVCQSLTKKKDEDQFKYFEQESRYFINSDGYVTFHSSFKNLNLKNEKPYVKTKSRLMSKRGPNVVKDKTSKKSYSTVLKKLLDSSENSCNGEDVNCASSSSNIASSSSNLPVSNETAEPSMKCSSEINCMQTMQAQNLSNTEETEISEAESKLVNKTISVSKLKSSQETINNCHKNCSTRSQEMSSEFDTGNASNYLIKSLEENGFYDNSNTSNSKSNPDNIKSTMQENVFENVSKTDLDCSKLLSENSSSIECFTSSHIVDPQNSSAKSCSNFSNAPSSEEGKSLLDWPNISFCDTAAKGDCRIVEAVKSNCDGPKKHSSNHSEKSSIVPEQSAINLKEYSCDSIQEMRAVNFFCVVLGNYQKYNCGISAEFLKNHLVQASSEVQSVIRDNYESDFLSFFKKHKNEFYVSPRSQDIYLQKK